MVVGVKMRRLHEFLKQYYQLLSNQLTIFIYLLLYFLIFC